MMKLGPGAGAMEANEQEKTPLSKLFTIEKRPHDYVVDYVIRGPFGAEVRFEISGEKDERKIRFTKMLHSSGRESERSMLVMFKGAVITAKNDADEAGEHLEFVEIPLGDRDLEHLFHAPQFGDLLGHEALEQGKELFNPRPEETPKRRATDHAGAIVVKLSDLTERLKEFEEQYGEIRA